MWKLLLFCLALTGLAFSQGPFDLLPGHWSGPGPQGEPLHFSVHQRSFSIQDGNLATIRGHYRVVANKGQPQVSLRPESIESGGRSLQRHSIAGWQLELGKNSRILLDYNHPNLTFSAFDSEAQLLFDCTLTKKAQGD